MNKKVVITGGAGFIGSKLGYDLFKDGFKVTLLDDISFGYESNLTMNGETFGEFVQQDVRSRDLVQYLEGADCVFHLAAISALPVCQSEPDRAISINVGGTASVLEAARQAGVRRVVLASTSAIYENNTKFPCSEDDPVEPNLLYSVSKLCAEHLCKAFSNVYGMEIAITRYYNVYGPNQDVQRQSPPFVGYVIRELLTNKRPILHSDGKQQRDYVYIDDVNNLNRLCMTQPEAVGQTFNVASGHSYSVNEIFEMVAELLGSNLKPVFRESTQFWNEYPSLFNGVYPLHGQRIAKEVDKFTLGSTCKARETLGWQANTPIRDGLKTTIDHARRLLN
jgi:nucleoside-diphosphate-sugar epimerase